jgi:hypothetical protein
MTMNPRQIARAFKRRRAIEQWPADLQAIAYRAQFRLDCIALNARNQRSAYPGIADISGASGLTQ